MIEYGKNEYLTSAKDTSGLDKFGVESYQTFKEQFWNNSQNKNYLFNLCEYMCLLVCEVNIIFIAKSHIDSHIKNIIGQYVGHTYKNSKNI